MLNGEGDKNNLHFRYNVFTITIEFDIIFLHNLINFENNEPTNLAS